MEEDVDSFCNAAETHENRWAKEGSKDYINVRRSLSQSDALEQTDLPYKVLGSLSLREPRQSGATVPGGYLEFSAFSGRLHDAA